MPGSPRIPRKDFAVGVWRAAVFTAAALGVYTLVAQDPQTQPPRSAFDRLLAPLTDLAAGGVEPPPAPLPERAVDAGRARVSVVATVSARFASRWTEGDEEVTLLRHGCTVQHAGTTLLADQMVLWRRRTEDGERLVLYLDGNARREQAGVSTVEPSMVLDLAADRVDFQISGQRIDQPETDDPVYRRAVERRKATPEVDSHLAARPPTDVLDVSDPTVGYETVRVRSPEGRLRRIRIFPRSSVPFDIESIRSTQTIPPEQVTVLTGGVNVLIDAFDDMGVVDLSADRIVIWTQATGEDFQAETVQTDDTPFTVYLEGNIVIRQGQGAATRLVRAERAIYDAREERALMDRAELRAFVPQIGGDLRLRADQLRQIGRGRYQALNAWTTTSQFGKPGYRLQAREIFVEPRYDVNLQWLGAGSTVVDPSTGMEMTETNWVRSYDNTVFVEDVPVLYSPYIAGPAADVNIPLKQLSFGNDDVFGFRVKTAWDPFDLFGVEPPPDIDLSVLADYYSERGPGGGLSGSYRGDDLFGIDDRYRGEGIGYYVNDDGLDRLGQFRNDLLPATEDRYRIKWRHRHELPGGVRANAELGIQSDRNMLEQYFEPDFNADKDQENLLYATQSLDPWGYGNWGWEFLGKAPINQFETEAGWYPKADLWGLSEPLFDGWLTWSNHTVAGYGDLEPVDAAEADYLQEPFFTPLPYAPDVEGATFMTRHQLDAHLPIGPVNVVPFAMGEAAFWEEGMDGTDLGRLTSSIGTRASMQFERIFPSVYNRILGLNGLAHKIRLEGEYRITDTTEPLDAVAQYNEIDDNAQERLRYRLPDFYFGGNLPPELEPRFYGVRTGAGVPLGSPYYELVDDQQVVRLAVRQRLQTKTGPPGRLRIRDWMTLDTGLSLFPNPDRDNFGEEVGLLFANYTWAVSERTKFLANAQYDPFENAPQLWNLGFTTQRTRRGSLYLGVRHVGFAGIDTDTLIGSYSYVMSPKWISTLSAFVDARDTDNTGESFSLTRVGADFLLHLGLQNNNNTDNFGFTFAIEPRFGNVRGSTPMQLSSLLVPTINP